MDRVGPDWIRTNDLFQIDAEGFVWFAGRADDVIMRGGFKILPQKVETALRTHPDVIDAAVCGVDDVRLGQIPVAAIVPRDPANPPSHAALTAYARATLLTYEVPVRFVMEQDIPATWR